MRQLIRRCKGRRVLEGGFGPVGLGACAALLGYDLFLADVTDEDA
jgi:hypothetical protein